MQFSVLDVGLDYYGSQLFSLHGYSMIDGLELEN